MVKRIFHLKNINTFEIERQYGLTPSARDIREAEPIPAQSTQIQALGVGETRTILGPRTGLFVDELRVNQDGVVSTANAGTHCFWCRHPFPGVPVACPVQMETRFTLETYTSQLNANRYTFQHPEVGAQMRADGHFCSFECCLAYIHDNESSPLYVNSEPLLKQLFFQTHGLGQLKPAPHWRTLLAYGGSLTIQEFRASFYAVEYTQEMISWDIASVLFKQSYTVF